MTADAPPQELWPRPWHRWAINEDPNAPSRYLTSRGLPDHCLTCGVVRHPLAEWAVRLAEGPCPGPQPHRAVGQHVTALEERPVTQDHTRWVYLGRCSCGWGGPPRVARLSSEDDATRHLLEVQS